MAFKRCYCCLPAVFLLVLVLQCSGCARYAQQINMLYEPVVGQRGGAGDLFVTIPASTVRQGEDVVWIIGDVLDNDGKVIDHLTSPRSPAELVQSALTQELNQAGYNVIAAPSPRPQADRAVEVSRVELALDQVSALADIKATCKLVVAITIRQNGTVVRKLQYEVKQTKTDIADRDLLVREVFRAAMRAAMRQAVPEIMKVLGQ